MKTFEIGVQITGYRDLFVDAESASEALEIAKTLIRQECNNIQHLNDVKIIGTEIYSEDNDV